MKSFLPLTRFLRTNARRTGLTAVFAVLSVLPAQAQVPTPQYVVAANLDVYVTNFDNVAGSVGVVIPYQIGDFRMRGENPGWANNGDYDVQIGPDPRDDVKGGALITSIREGARVNQSIDGLMNPLYPGTNWATSHAAWANNTPTVPGETNGYFIPVAMAWPNAITTQVIEYDYNVAAAWFPYDKFIAGNAHYTDQGTMNNTTLDELWGSPGLTLGTHFIDSGSADYTVDLRSLGISSQTDGILLATGAQNEDNFAAVYANTNGTWTVQDKDNGATGTGERDPVEFVFIPKTNSSIISGRFLASGAIDFYSGTSPRFTVASKGTGTWELKFPGLTPAHGVLIITPEGGRTDNNDNIAFYEVNPAKDGFLIYSRDIPGTQLTTVDNSIFNPLETPADPTEPVVSFAFILGATPGIIVTPSDNIQTSEAGGTATFTVALNTKPTANVTLGITSSDTSEGTVSPASLTFTPDNWSTPQTVTVTGVDDALTDGPIDYSIVFAAATSADATYSGLKPDAISALNTDNEVGITVAPAAGLVTTEAGGTATFTIQLNTAPTANVTIGLTSSDTTEGTVLPASVTFTPANWNTKQTVTVTGVDDGLDDGDIAYNIVTAAATSTDANYNGQNALDIEVNNTDNDTAAIVVTPTALSIVEGQTGTFAVKLASQPTAEVVVSVASGNTTNGPAAPSSLTFTPANWSTPQTVTITAVDNATADGNVIYNVTNTATTTDTVYTNINPEDVVVTLVDNEAALAAGLSIYGSEGTMVTYGSGFPAMIMTPFATLADPSIVNYAGATFVAAVTANASPDDRLAIRSYGTGADQIGVSGSTITYSNVAIGTFTGGSGSTPLTVTLNAAATPVSLQALMRAITFQNVNSSPSTAQRTVTYSLTHADAGVATVNVGVRVGMLKVAEFQQGVDRGFGIYTNAYDTTIAPGPEYRDAYSTGDSGINTNYALWMDAPTAGAIEGGEALLRFDNIVGTAAGQIPTNATIVYAELVLTIPPSVGNSPGDGSPLYRMLVTWDPQTLTWANAGNGDLTGFQPNDVHARSTFDSFLSASDGSASTGTGTINFGVTPDVNAWVNGGEANYGWLMPGWFPPASAAARTDGTAFACSEWPNNPAERPLLRVYWLPKDTPVASFRQGQDGYTGAQDTAIRAYSTNADNTYYTSTTHFVDWTVTASPAPVQNEEQVLFQFKDIIGSGTGQVPMYSRIEAAMLDLASPGNNAMGDGGRFYAMLKPWTDSTTTWNSLDNGVSADGVEAAATPTAVAGYPSREPNVQAAFLSFDMTKDVQAWAIGSMANNGWVILPWAGGGDGWGIATSEQSNPLYRPQLRVYYTPGAAPVPVTLQKPVVSGGTVQIKFSGKANTSYTLQRTAALPSGWGTLTTVTTDATGLGSYTDNAPPASGAFYRVLSN